MDPLDPPPSDPPARKRSLWIWDTLQDTEKHILAKGNFTESKNSCWYQGYIAAMSMIIQVEPSTFEEVVKEQVWKDVVAEEYESIMKISA